ncbi:MAG TPA: hypothetical protein VEI97_09360, partial [bacterium]|nr:hypothetical protein [bacterium]
AQIAELLRRCQVPVLVIPQDLGPESSGLLALFDGSAASNRALPVAAAVAERVGQALNIMATGSEEESAELEEMVERTMERSYAQWQLLLVQGGSIEELPRYAMAYGPALCVLGVEGGGAGITTKFGPAPLDPVVRGLLDQGSTPLLCVPEWGEPLQPRPLIGGQREPDPPSRTAQA